MVHYKLKYENPNTHFLSIEATFDTKDQSTFYLQFPTWRPGRYEMGNFVKNIHSWQITDENGKLVDNHKIEKDQWEVAVESVNSITVSYKYYAYELNAGSTFIDVNHFYVNPVNCCVYESGNEERLCEVELDIPDSFTIASGQPFKNKKAVFNSYHEWVDNPVIASDKMLHNTYESHGVLFHIWINGECKPDWDKILKDFQQFTDCQIETFGEFPVQEYHFMFQIAPYQLYHGVEHQYSTVCALGPSTEIMGNLYDEFLGVSSHELYHTWNVKAIRPIEMYPYDYSQENYTELGYLDEGVTTYMGDLFLWKSKVFNEKQYFKLFEGQMNRHFSNFGRFNQSVAESSFNTWIDGYTKGIPNRKVSIYTEGCLISFMIDVLIMRASKNRKSIHDVMRQLYFNFACDQKGVSAKDYQETIESVAGESFEQFFTDYIRGTSSYESCLYECLEYLGLELKMRTSPIASESLLGIKKNVVNGLTKIVDIYPGGTADLMGMSEGDEIIAINGYKITNDFDHWLSYFKEDPMEISFFRNNKMKTETVPNTNKKYFSRYYLDRVEVPSQIQINAFKNWSGSDLN